MVKACALAHWSLSCSIRCTSDVASCISQAMAVLGPAITLDTLVETLVIGIGTLSGIVHDNDGVVHFPHAVFSVGGYSFVTIAIIIVNIGPFSRCAQSGSALLLRLHVGRCQLRGLHDVLSCVSGTGY